MKVSEAVKITGGLSKPSKMPGPAYSLPAKDCQVGSALAKIAGTTCYNCYALKGRYSFPNVQNALTKRLNSLTNPLWVEAMVTMIRSSKTKYFRWHDSGDIQSIEHLRMIVQVSQQLPKVKFWLPTREYTYVRQYMESNIVPKNLTIRLSAHVVNKEPPSRFGLPTSTVHTSKLQIIGEECMAYTRDNKCGTCRSCWNPKVANVSYPKH